MRRASWVIVLAMVALFLTLSACAGTSKIGSIGVHDIYMVQTCDPVSPCTTTILTLSTKDGALNKIEGGTGPSMLGQVLGPASVAAAGYFIGDGLGDSGDQITNTENTTANLTSKSEGSNSASTSKGGAGGSSFATGGRADSSAKGGNSVAFGGNSSSRSTAGSSAGAVSSSVSKASSEANSTAVGVGFGH